ncbi:unannotated protein [freshwater metagenome]|uniref:Unannotated protein n=1 Tax=freshwater metagenome TaxID=449393 RepID=A0A6J7KDM0_9ZZZZ
MDRASVGSGSNGVGGSAGTCVGSGAVEGSGAAAGGAGDAGGVSSSPRPSGVRSCRNVWPTPADPPAGTSRTKLATNAPVLRNFRFDGAESKT